MQLGANNFRNQGDTSCRGQLPCSTQQIREKVKNDSGANEPRTATEANAGTMKEEAARRLSPDDHGIAILGKCQSSVSCCYLDLLLHTAKHNTN